MFISSLGFSLLGRIFVSGISLTNSDIDVSSRCLAVSIC